MKINNLFFTLLLLILVCGCAKDKGFYNENIQKVTYDGTILEYLKSKCNECFKATPSLKEKHEPHCNKTC
jgi:hypothetical protein